MTVLESFLSFARRLPADQLESVESTLAELMATYSDEHGFTPAEMDELDRRVREPSPVYAHQSAITELFGKPFKA